MKNWNLLLMSGILALSSTLALADRKIDENTPGAGVAKNFVNSVFTPAMKASGWKATGYGSSASPVQALVWITPGGDCYEDMSFAMDITNPSSPKVYYVSKSEHANNALYSGAIKNIELPLVAAALTVSYDVDVIRDHMNASKGKKTNIQAQDTAELKKIADLSKAGDQLKRSFQLYAAGKVADAQKALPKPTGCVTQAAPAAKPNPAVVNGHVPSKLPSPRPAKGTTDAESATKNSADGH